MNTTVWISCLLIVPIGHTLNENPPFGRRVMRHHPALTAVGVIVPRPLAFGGRAERPWGPLASGERQEIP